MVKNILVFAVAAILTVAFTRVIWLQGFDQGSAVALCVVKSYKQFEGHQLAINEKVCQQAKAYQSNPLWLLRRR